MRVQRLVCWNCWDRRVRVWNEWRERQWEWVVNAWAKRKSDLHCLLQPGPIVFPLLQNKKMMRKCESFEFEDTLNWRKGSSMCVYVHYMPKHWKLRLNFLQWLKFSWLLQDTPGGHLEEWGSLCHHSGIQSLWICLMS